LAIHADAKKLHAKTAVLKNVRPVSARLKVRLVCLPVNEKERPVPTGQSGQQMPVNLFGKAGIAPKLRQDLVKLDKSSEYSPLDWASAETR